MYCILDVRCYLFTTLLKKGTRSAWSILCSCIQQINNLKYLKNVWKKKLLYVVFSRYYSTVVEDGGGGGGGGGGDFIVII